MTGVLTEEVKVQRDDTQGTPVKTGAEIEMMRLQARKAPGWPATTRS